jgi:hypothetical protein
VVSARIDAGDEIRITTLAPSSLTYTFTDGQGQSVTLPGGVILVGEPAGTGSFDKALIPLDAGGYPGAFPITMSFLNGGQYTKHFDSTLGSGVVQVGRNVFDESLLSYVIFAANEETRAARIRRGLGSGDDLGAPACQ